MVEELLRNGGAECLDFRRDPNCTHVVVDDSTGGRVVVDTGTSMIMGPTQLVTENGGINSIVLCTSSRSQG